MSKTLLEPKYYQNTKYINDNKKKREAEKLGKPMRHRAPH
jgi:hypothetical protein